MRNNSQRAKQDDEPIRGYLRTEEVGLKEQRIDFGSEQDDSESVGFWGRKDTE
jgi:hypothetical protein